MKSLVDANWEVQFYKMENTAGDGLVGAEIHGFRTMADLDIADTLEEAKSRWLRPNEIHAILCNHKHFIVQVKPVNLPPSGTMVLFDRKMLRNFRKDGHNWKKKKDGKTVKEAHEHLKVGNEERIHVYYAHGEDNPTFVRRCYWLLDKSLEHIVLVHYRETQEYQGSPAGPVNSGSTSAQSLVVSEEYDSAVYLANCSSQRAGLDPDPSMNITNHEMTLHEINTLEWDELLVTDDSNTPCTLQEGTGSLEQLCEYETNGYRTNSDSISANNLRAGCHLENFPGQVSGGNYGNFSGPANMPLQAVGDQLTSNPQHKNFGTTVIVGDSLVTIGQDGLQTQDSFGRWIDEIITVKDEVQRPIPTSQPSFSSLSMGHQSPALEQIFYITDISPAWAYSNEDTKILVVGHFHQGLPDLVKSNVLCICGDVCFRAEVVQPGVFRCVVSPQKPGIVNFFLSFDGCEPISQLMTFEFRAPITHNYTAIASEEKSSWDELRAQMRLVHLLFSTSRSFDILSSEVSENALKEAERFARKTSDIRRGWVKLAKLIKTSEISFPQAKNNLFELTLKNRLYEWLLERVIDGCKITEKRDDQGQGVIHLCAILDYAWAVYPFSWSGLSLDYRDKYGWTALHWAAYYGREKMAANLLSAGAKANLVTDPTAENPGGCTAADLASQNDHEGLAAYLAEKALVHHFEAMTLAGNVSGSLQTAASNTVVTGNFSEEELYLKDTLAAYRTAADAAARIQTAFREHSLKVRAIAVQSSNPEIEARNIVAAMKIQHAFRKYETRKQMAAAARIQYRFRSWKIRKEFLNMRRHAIKIQAYFRAFQVRRQYRKIIWSVGVLEKAVLRWRLKRKGFRGLQVHSDESVMEQKEESDVEDDFFQASRKQAEDRVERSVVRVQAMFRSRRAQEEYRRMKLTHITAKLEYDELQNPDEMRGD